MKSSWAEPVGAGLGGLSTSWRGWVLRPAGPALWGRGSAPHSLGADCALGGHADRQGRARAGLLWAKDQGPWLAQAPRHSSLPYWDSKEGAVELQQRVRKRATSARGGTYRDPALGRSYLALRPALNTEAIVRGGS